MATIYSPIPNTFRQNLQANKKQIGCWCSLGSPLAAEVLGAAGFDWILIDGEHAPNDLQSFLSQLMALKDSRSAPVVRPQWAEPIIIKRLLDLGFFNFLMPFVDNAEQAREIVAATRYPPEGIRGVSLSNRGNRFGYRERYHDEVNDNITVLAQIESKEGLRNVEEIASVEGVDGLFVGPSDLSADLGCFPDTQHPKVQGAIREILRAGAATGTAVGTIAVVEEQARRYLDMGMTCVAVGADLGLLKNVTQELRNKFRSND